MHARKERTGRPGWFGDVMMTYLPPFLKTVAEMVADMYHQINQAFPNFLACEDENIGRPRYEANCMVNLSWSLTHCVTSGSTHIFTPRSCARGKVIVLSVVCCLLSTCCLLSSLKSPKQKIEASRWFLSAIKLSEASKNCLFSAS